MATRKNLEIYRGDTVTLTCTAKSNGTAINLTSGTARMTVKYSPYDADADAVFSVYSPSNGIVLTTPASGIFTVTLAPALTTSLPAHRLDLFYDLRFTTSSGAVYTLAAGQFTILPNISITTP